MNEKIPPDSHRRRLLKRAATGLGGAAFVSQLPERWTRPVISTVILPAHAQTSPGRATITSCQINSATPFAGGTNIDFSFTIVGARPDGTPIGSGVTMDVQFTFAPSGATLPPDLVAQYPLDGSGTFTGVRAVTNAGADGQNSVSMTVSSDLGIGDTNAPCSTGATSITPP